MRNRHISVYMKLAVFPPCFFVLFVFIPRGGPFQDGIHMQQEKKKLLIFSVVSPPASLPEMRNEEQND